MNIEQYQTQLAALQCNLERISLLQRKSRARLQIVHRNNKFFIRSISDKYKNIRILILSLMMHIYHHKQHTLINHLKSIVYESQLHLLTASHGLLKEELHKNIGMHFDQIGRAHDLQGELIRCFNCVAFFDQVLVTSFAQYFSSNDFSSLQNWQLIIGKSFQLQVHTIKKEQIEVQFDGHAQILKKDQHYICLEIDGNSVYLHSNYRHSIETDRMSDKSIVSIESVEHQGKNTMNTLLTVSIEDIQSPFNKENVNNINTQQYKNHKISPFQSNLRPLQKSRKMRKSFWNIFCCGTD